MRRALSLLLFAVAMTVAACGFGASADEAKGGGDFGRFCDAVNAIEEVKDEAFEALRKENPDFGRPENRIAQATAMRDHDDLLDDLVESAPARYADMAEAYTAGWRAWDPADPTDISMFETAEWDETADGFYRAWNNDCP
jgi:hypothetical protein